MLQTGRGGPLSYEFLCDPSFHESLLLLDRELAAEARRQGCLDCGGQLHRANYLRRPMGGPHPRAIRFSFCCAEDGCRKRRTPSSMRFLARRVYLGVIVVLASVLWRGRTRRRVARLADVLGVRVSERTLGRWRRWWLFDFASSRFWRSRRGHFAEPVARDRLPTSLFERFAGGDDPRSQVVALLRFLLPITGGQGLLTQAF